MAAYVVALMSVHDAKICREYTDRTPPTMKKYGGRLLTRGEPVSTVEGEPYEGGMVLLEFPSKADVESWYTDPDYQEALKFQHVASTMNMLLLQESAVQAENPDPHL